MFGSWYGCITEQVLLIACRWKLDLPASLAKRYASDPTGGGVGYGIGKFKCFKIHY
jgi:hypothetical protein